MGKTNLWARNMLAILVLLSVCALQSCSSDNDEPGETPPPSTGPEQTDDVCTLMNDINFMKFCYENYDVNKDGKVSESEASAVMEMEITVDNIKSLEGIQYFEKLTKLSVASPVTSLDISKNTKLTSLTLNHVSLASLNISNCTALTYLHLSGDNLTALDTSNSKELKYLYVSGKNLETLIIEENTQLESLYLDNTALTSLDVSNNLQLKVLDTSSSPALKEIILAPDQKIETLNPNPGTEVNIPPVPDDMGKLEITFDFEPSNPGTRAFATPVPKTSWSNIKQVQFFLYDEAGTVKYSSIVNPVSSSRTFTYTDIPLGAYTVVAVANAKSDTDDVVSYIGSTAMGWDSYNVRLNSISDLYMEHKPFKFPDYANPGSGNKAYIMPPEIFMAESSNVTITAGQATTASLSLKREISMMRVRVNTKDMPVSEINWGNNASILIYNLPDKMNIGAGNMGGVSTSSTSTNVMAVHGALHTSNPTTGYEAGQILNNDFTMWKDIIVFPNNGGRANDEGNSIHASEGQKYFIVLSAQGKIGHVLANGEILANEQTVYWYGSVEGGFMRNCLREVSLTLKTGGTNTLPSSFGESGNFEMTIGTPVPLNYIMETEIQ